MTMTQAQERLLVEILANEVRTTEARMPNNVRLNDMKGNNHTLELSSFRRSSPSARRWGSFTTWCFALLSMGLLAGHSAALRHNFYTEHDNRRLIGPIGFPFGFLDTGHYNLTVYDFEVQVSSRRLGENGPEIELESKDERRRQLPSYAEVVYGVGFLLKRCESEAAFNQFMADLEENHLCAFKTNRDDDSSYPSHDDDGLFPGGDDFYANDDEDTNDVDGVEVDATGAGIFLSMLDESRMWRNNTPSMVYSFQEGEAGLYFLIYQVCTPPPASDGGGMEYTIHSKFELDFHFFNVDRFGNDSYLSAGEMILPNLFFYFAVLYFICLALWWTNLQKIKAGEQGHWPTPGSTRPVIYPIHYLMATLLLLKMLSILFESIRYHYIRVSGKAVLWSAVYYTFSFVKGTFLFTVILLIGSGWSFVKPFINVRERNMILGILVLQVINNVAIVVLTQEAEGEKAFDRWTGVLHMVDILCCCAVLIPIVWQVNQLEKNIEQSSGDRDAEIQHTDNDDIQVPEDEFDEIPLNSPSRNRRMPPDIRLVSKLRLFRSFYLLVVAYIYVTRIVVYLFATMLDYRHVWLRHFVVEAVTLAFYCTVGMQFRPMGENPYLSIRKEEDIDGVTGQQAEIELTT